MTTIARHCRYGQQKYPKHIEHNRPRLGMTQYPDVAADLSEATDAYAHNRITRGEYEHALEDAAAEAFARMAGNV